MAPLPPRPELPDPQINQRIAWLWMLACLLILALVWTAALQKIRADRQQRLDTARTEVAARANTYAEQVLRTVLQIDQLSMVIKYEWERKGSRLDLEEQFQKGLYQTAVYPVAINAEGVAVSGTRNLARGTYMGDLDSFKAVKADPDAGLIISPLAAGRGGFTGKKIIRFTRRFSKPDGAFDGAALVAIEPEFITSFQDTSMLGEHDFISVRFVDGSVMANKIGGGGNKPYVFYRETPKFATPQGTLIEPGNKFFDQAPRVVGWKKLEGYPLITLAAVSQKNALTPYASTQKTYLGIAAVLSFLTVLGAALGAFNQIRNVARRRHAAQVQKTFRLAVDTAREGFYMIRPLYNHSGHLVEFLVEDCNERAAEIAGVPRSALIGKCTSDLYEGVHADNIRAFFAQVLEKGFNENEFHILQGRRHTPGWFQRRAVKSGAGIAVTIRDVSEARQQAETLALMARTDALTGLHNRHWLNDYMPGALERAGKSGTCVALLFIDLDNFKDVNDSLGHKAGDDVLCAVAKTLRHAIRPEDQLARLGGDEFTVIIENLASSRDAEQVGDQLIKAIDSIHSLAAWGNFSVKASIGISVYPSDGDDVNSLLQCADIAMYEAKSGGKARYRHYDALFAQKIKDRISTERALEHAIRNDEFVLYYQPRAHAGSGQFCSMEALIRWRHPERGLLPPVEFINIAERSRIIIPLGEVVIEKVCAQLAHWQGQGLLVKPVSINVSALQLKDDRLRIFLADCLRRHQIAPTLIAIELTESSMLEEEGEAPNELRQLHEMGIELQIDDFGTGYSSLSKLQQLDIDAIKIDQSFTRRLGQDQQSNALCEAIISMARTLDITVAAEGVETDAQLRILQAMGCEEIQGYLISPPVPAEAIPALMARGKFFEPLPGESVILRQKRLRPRLVS